MSSPSTPAEAGAPQALRWWMAMAVAVGGMYLSSTDSSIMSTALSAVRDDFNVSASDAAWIITAYRLSQAMVIPASAWLAERWGLRRIYLASLALFAVLSLLASRAWDLGSLVLFRALQAVPGAVVPVVSAALLSSLVPPRHRMVALSWYGLCIVAATGFSPLIGGYLVEHSHTWRAIFYLDAPVAVVIAVATLFLVPDLPGRRGRRFDLLGYLTLVAGLSTLLVAVSQGTQWGWTSYTVLILATVGVLALALFVILELEFDEPLIDLRAIGTRSFLGMLVLVDVMFIGLYVVLADVPAFAGQAQGLTLTHTGLVLLPQALVWMVMMPLSRRIFLRFGARRPAALGMALVGFGSLLLSRITTDTDRPELVVWLCVRAFGIGLALLPMLAAANSSLPPAVVGQATALRTLVQRIVAVLGSTGVAALVTRLQAQSTADRSGLLGSGAAMSPRFANMDSGTLEGLWTEMQRQVATQAYSEVFLLVGVCTLVGVVVALVTLPGRSRPAAAPPAAPARQARPPIPAVVLPVEAPPPASAPDPVLVLASRPAQVVARGGRAHREGASSTRGRCRSIGSRRDHEPGWG